HHLARGVESNDVQLREPAMPVAFHDCPAVIRQVFPGQGLTVAAYPYRRIRRTLADRVLSNRTLANRTPTGHVSAGLCHLRCAIHPPYLALVVFRCAWNIPSRMPCPRSCRTRAACEASQARWPGRWRPEKTAGRTKPHEPVDRRWGV